MSEPAAPDVRLETVVKRFDDVVAVDGISVEIPRGSFFALLGPSGCGKTTMLNLVAGLMRPTTGTVNLGALPDGTYKIKAYAATGNGNTGESAFVTDIVIDTFAAVPTTASPNPAAAQSERRCLRASR